MVRRYYNDIAIDFTDEEYARLEEIRANRQGTQQLATSMRMRTSKLDADKLNDRRIDMVKAIVWYNLFSDGDHPTQVQLSRITGIPVRAISHNVVVLRHTGIVTSPIGAHSLTVDEQRFRQLLALKEGR